MYLRQIILGYKIHCESLLYRVPRIPTFIRVLVIPNNFAVSPHSLAQVAILKKHPMPVLDPKILLQAKPALQNLPYDRTHALPSLP